MTQGSRLGRWLGLCVLLGLAGLAAGQSDGSQAAWTGVERVVAVGDVHGNYDQFVRILRDAGLVDERLRWIGGSARLVQIGDVLDRGPHSRRVMDLLMRLEREADNAGGRVHALIGNHEAMNLYGDLHDVHPGEYEAFRDGESGERRQRFYERYVERLKLEAPETFREDEAFRARFEEQFPLGFVEHRLAFAKTGPYGRWIREHQAVLKIDETLFVHGGISPSYAAFTIDEINGRIRRELDDEAKLADFDVLQASTTGDPEGPLWYRALVNGSETALAEHVDRVLEHHGVRRMVVGHTPNLGTVIPRFGGKLLSIDVGLTAVYGGPPASLVMERGVPYSLHRGVRLDLPDRSAGALVEYLQRAAALEPEGSVFRGRVAELNRPAPVAIP